MEFMEDVLVNVIDEEVEEIKKNFNIEGFEVIGKTMKEIEEAAKARKVTLKLKPIKKQLAIYRSRTNSVSLQNKIDRMIIKIDDITDRVYEETSDTVNAHSI